jgi:hypothetical protein
VGKVTGPVNFAGSEFQVELGTSDVQEVLSLIEKFLKFFQRRDIAKAKKFLVFGYKSVGKDAFLRRLADLPLDAIQPPTSQVEGPLEFNFYVDISERNSVETNFNSVHNVPGEALELWVETFDKVQPDGIIFIVDEPRDMVVDLNAKDYDGNPRLTYIPGDQDYTKAENLQRVETRQERIESTQKALEFTLSLLGEVPESKGFFDRLMPKHSPLESHIKCVMVLVNRWDKRDTWQEKSHQREAFLSPYRALLSEFEDIHQKYPNIIFLSERLNLYEDDNRDFGQVVLKFALGILGLTMRDLR